ncbi:alpha/beta fold hydrolase [Niabella ginsengisoli]|uniref:Alpha/beta hydrolase n=1 Tax=Niabella ginsengisoli TaxID=522298 RepID=A0ABS9SJJ8_9BACT|nr:alpha/beta hydrolase [Niabella ginsengisoli]MCH5598496.1 alpha/beta hydrolase [Niabella ginsengisoli]
MERKTTTVEGKVISYITAGDGKAVVLLHGFGVDSTAWSEQIEYLKDHYFIIAPDLPGIGVSELTNDVSMEGVANLIKEIIENEEVEQAAVIGHSMGGYATLAFAEKYPELLTGIGLFHSTAGADNDEKKSTRKKGIEFTQKHGANAFLETTAPKMFAETTKKENETLYNRFMGNLPEMSKEAVIDYYEAMMARTDRTDVLKNAKVPVLFIYGEQDEIIPLDKTIEQASFPSISTIHILKNSGHLGMIEEPAEANKAIEDFLSDI